MHVVLYFGHGNVKHDMGTRHCKSQNAIKELNVVTSISLKRTMNVVLRVTQRFNWILRTFAI